MNKIDYKVGDEIVCVEDHQQSVVKIGETFKAYELIKCPCGCNKILVDVGIKSTSKRTKCAITGNLYKNFGKWYLRGFLFKKIDTLINISELTEVLKESQTA